MEDKTFVEISELMRNALERRRDKSRIAVLDYMSDEIEKAKNLNIEPDWKKLFKESRKIWWDNL